MGASLADALDLILRPAGNTSPGAGPEFRCGS